VVAAAGCWQEELRYSEAMVERDVRNNSAWAQRAFVNLVGCAGCPARIPGAGLLDCGSLACGRVPPSGRASSTWIFLVVACFPALAGVKMSAWRSPSVNCIPTSRCLPRQALLEQRQQQQCNGSSGGAGQQEQEREQQQQQQQQVRQEPQGTQLEAAGATAGGAAQAAAAAAVRRRAAFLEMLPGEFEYVAAQLAVAPRNDSAWNYLCGLFSLPGATPHEMGRHKEVGGLGRVGVSGRAGRQARAGSRRWFREPLPDGVRDP
jgi:hypothetical protein